jgi:hypothetical protein
MRRHGANNLFRGAAACFALLAAAASGHADRMIEPWERQHALIEKRHAFVMDQLTDIDKRVPYLKRRTSVAADGWAKSPDPASIKLTMKTRGSVEQNVKELPRPNLLH